MNDEPIYTGSSLGQFSGLDLGQNMYLGNVPDANNVPEPARFSSGYVGKKLFCFVYGILNVLLLFTKCGIY